ncbi:hypothetical protein ABEB36_013926 [Hypothenemus hampei]|uniref:Uncharacterized protein n=1 Tax=Hypothenemus hampei TaxID=57062 RepID=A0ABD1E5P7_HYPHA
MVKSGHFLAILKGWNSLICGSILMKFSGIREGDENEDDEEDNDDDDDEENEEGGGGGGKEEKGQEEGGGEGGRKEESYSRAQTVPSLSVCSCNLVIKLQLNSPIQRSGVPQPEENFSVS